MDPIVRDALEVLLVIAVGGILCSAIGRLRRGEVSVPRCQNCGRAVSRGDGRCRECGTELGS
jgi:predicted amidophosphoribosyltransferase